jgi:hypothetical protein
VGGFTGEVLGGAATVTGIGVAVGVPAMVVSTTLVVGGAGNIAAGIRGLMTTGSGSSGPPSTPAVKGEGVASILKDATPGKVSKSGMGSTQYSKSGGFQRANADFDSLARSSQIKRYPGDIRSTTLPDGTKISVRPGSSQGDPTLQIEIPGQNPIKVRYGQ